MGDEEISNLTEVIRSGKLFRYGGQFVVRFEEEFAGRYGAKHAVAATSGTAALHVAVGALQPNPGDEIITSPITDMGTIIPILFQNAIPVFADLEPDMYCMQPQSIAGRITDRTAAIIVVHLFGQPADMDSILALARDRGIPVIEDCAQAYLTEYHGTLAGTMGDIGCFSLQQSKHMTAGDGGIIITDDDDIAMRARLFADKGWPRQGEARDYMFLGANYRMNELTGAVACAQLGKVESVVANRRAAAEKLTARINEIEGVNPPAVRDNCKHSYWQYPITVDEDVLGTSPRDFVQALSAEGIPAGVGYIGRPIYMTQMLHDKKAYGSSHCPWECKFAGRSIEYRKDDCPDTLEILRRIIIIPWNENYGDREVNDIADGLDKVAAHFRGKQ
ncbi:MAG: DegT/DnrJ/EryC1/StrS family aminotransferase [Armatimonadota bacterium]|nr:MAG: DegT/DnrJ/EryC1/StrS family aminotransferase [Armatimonadota bacterium]